MCKAMDTEAINKLVNDLFLIKRVRKMNFARLLKKRPNFSTLLIT